MKSAISLVIFLVSFVVFADYGGVQSTFSGQGRLRYERSAQTDYVSDRSAFYIRMRPELTLSKGPDFKLFFQPQFSKALGQPSSPALVTSGATLDGSLDLHQAYLEYSAFDHLKFTLGRQILSYGDQVVLSGLDWNNVGRSFDALRAGYAHDIGNIDIFYSKIFAARVTSTPIGTGTV